MSTTGQDETRGLSRPVRKRAKIVQEPAFSGTFSGESENDSESDFDTPKLGKGTGKLAKKLASTKKGAKIATKRPSKSVNAKTVSTVARNSPPPITPQAARLTRLPYDVIWEILAYYPTIPNWEVATNQTVLNPKYLQRYQVLRALSQTCRTLRFQCHPHLWEHIQACLLKEGGPRGSFYIQVSEALQKQSKIIISALPEFQPLVRTMTVSLTRYQVDKTLRPFADALELLPNLHTLRICHAHSQMSTSLKNAFEGHVFPQITTIALPSCAHNILRSCPNVKDIANIEGDGTQLAGAICKGCPRVERLANFSVTDFTLKRLAKALPKLRSFGLKRVTNAKELEVLSLFPELSTIEWWHYTGHYPWLSAPSSKEDKIKTATVLLRKSKFQGDKRIVIHHPYKAALAYGPPPVAGAAPVPQKEEDGYDEVFKLP